MSKKRQSSRYTYRSKRDLADEAPPRRQGKKGGFRVKFKRALKLVIAVVIITLALMLNTSPVVEVVGEEPPVRDSRQYVKHLEQLLEDDLRSYSKLTINKSRISENLTVTFPEISEVDIRTPLWSMSPRADLYVNRPSLILSGADSEFLVDAKGVAIAETSDHGFRQSLMDKLPRMVDQTNLRVDIGNPVLTPSQMDYLREVMFQLDQAQVKSEYLELKPGGEEVYIYFENLDYFGKFNFSVDAKKSAGAFIAMKERLDEKGTQPEQYIDVRVERRAFVL